MISSAVCSSSSAAYISYIVVDISQRNRDDEHQSCAAPPILRDFLRPFTALLVQTLDNKKKIIKISDRTRPKPFKMATHPVIVPGHRSISPHTLGSGTGGGFMLLSASSQRSWHVTQNNQAACYFGRIFQAVEVVWSPSAGAWEERGHFAIKVRTACLPHRLFPLFY